MYRMNLSKLDEGKVIIGVSLYASIAEQLKAHAAPRGTTTANLIRSAINDLLVKLNNEQEQEG